MSRLVDACRRATRTKRGSRALRVKADPDTRTFICRRCGTMVRLGRAYLHVRGNWIPGEYGCPRCDRRTWREACEARPARPNERSDIEQRRYAREALGLTDARIYRAMEHALAEMHR